MRETLEIESIKETHNITNKDIVAFAYDLNPNVALYYTRLKGFRIAPDFTQEHLTNIYTEKMPRILIVNSPDYLGKHHPKDLHIDFKVIAKTPTLVFYELDYSNVIEQKE